LIRGCDRDIIDLLTSAEPIGAQVYVRSSGSGNRGPRLTYPFPPRNEDFKILPEGPFGSSSMNRISRGYL
jgi:hypothetical protein